MRYSFITAAILALASSVVAQTPNFDPISAPTKDQTVAAGSSLDIIWEPGTYTGANTVTITLLQGADMGSLQLGPVISTGVSNALGKYTWKIPTTEGTFATYGFKISLDTNTAIFQYSFPFHISATGGISYSASITGSGSASVTPSTYTVQLSTGTGYTSSSAIVTSTSTSSIPSSTVTVVSTSSASSSSIVKPSSNVTIATLTKTTSTKASASSTSSPTTTPPATASTNSAVSNMATGGLAMLGGLFIALVL